MVDKKDAKRYIVGKGKSKAKAAKKTKSKAKAKGDEGNEPYVDLDSVQLVLTESASSSSEQPEQEHLRLPVKFAQCILDYAVRHYSVSHQSYSLYVLALISALFVPIAHLVFRFSSRLHSLPCSKIDTAHYFRLK